MKRVLAPELPTEKKSAELSPAEAQHAVRVLRLRHGDRVETIDGKGHSVQSILHVHGESVSVALAPGAQVVRETGVVPLVLEMAILKGDAMGWVVEKAVELGVQSLVPVVTVHTVVQLQRKGPEEFQQRWKRIADQALKQCGRLQAMTVELPVTIDSLVAQYPSHSSEPRFWCDEAIKGEAHTLVDFFQKADRKIRSARLLVGPEGGWSENERILLARAAGEATLRVGLGPLVLRAETAAISAVSVISAFLRASGGG